MSITSGISKFAGSIIVLWGWRASAVSFLAGAASALAMPPFDIFPVLFLTLPILVWLIDGATGPADSGFLRRLWPAFRIGWSFGFGYLLAGLWWIGQAFLVDTDEFLWLLPIAVIALPLGLGLFYGVGAALARIVWSDGWTRILALGAGFGVAEWLRGTVLTGLPWNALGHAAMTVPETMQSASLMGLYGVSVLAIVLFAAPGLIPSKLHQPKRTWLFWLACLVLAGSHVGFGVWRLNNANDATVAGVALRIVQPNIQQAEKWLPEKESEIIRTYIDLSDLNTSPETQGVGNVTHVIWPESAFPFILTERRDMIAAIAALLPEGTSLITGAARREKAADGAGGGFVFNSVYVLNDKGEIVGAQDKMHLVPFGEYLPFQNVLESFGLEQLTRTRGGFTAANSRSTLTSSGAPPFVPLICYEIIFPGQVDAKGEKPGWIVNLTNDGWFGNTPGPHQHLRHAQIRAVEEGLPVIRAANTGISAIIDSYGRITKQLALGKKGVIDGLLPQPAATTPFKITPNGVFWMLVITFFIISLFGKRKRTTGLN